MYKELITMINKDNHEDIMSTVSEKMMLDYVNDTIDKELLKLFIEKIDYVPVKYRLKWLEIAKDYKIDIDII